MCAPCMPCTDQLAERIFQSTVHALELFSIYLGKKLGLYAALRRHGPLTPRGLAAKAGIAPRYALEWLEQQAVAGFLEVVPDGQTGELRSFVLPAANLAVLDDRDHPSHVAPFAQMIASIGSVLPEVCDAWRVGGGVPYERYGEDFREGQGDINRPAFLVDLCTEWLPRIPGLHRELMERDGIRVADLACGQGWSTIALADAYPRAQVTGFDLDAASIEDARQRAEARDSRAEFRAIDGADLAEHGPFDLVLLIEALHDMPRPAEVLAGIRRSMAPGGVLILADERVAEDFTPKGDLLERMMYGWSLTHCLPVSMSEQPSRALGTVLRPSVMQDLAREAGFGSCEILDIPNDLFRFYRLQ